MCTYVCVRESVYWFVCWFCCGRNIVFTNPPLFNSEVFKILSEIFDLKRQQPMMATTCVVEKWFKMILSIVSRIIYFLFLNALFGSLFFSSFSTDDYYAKIRSHSFSCAVRLFLYIFQQHLSTQLKLWATLVFLGAKGTSIIDNLWYYSWLGERLNFLSQFPTRRRGGYTSMLVSRLLFILGASHLLNNVGVVVKLSLGTLSFCC